MRQAARMLSVVCAWAWAVCAGGASVLMEQQVVLKPGWNAFYLSVSPEMSPDAFFADWPVSFVAAYNPASFLATRQFTAESSTEGAADSGYLVWRRGDAGASTLARVSANRVYLAYSTAEANFARTVAGVPCAPQVNWHPMTSDESMNLIGISAFQETKIGDYLDGLDAGKLTYNAFVLWGDDVAQPKFQQVFQTTPLKHGDVVALSVTKVSDWSGVLNVSPAAGLDFSTNGVLGTLTVRNDSAHERMVSVTLGSSKGTGESALGVPAGLYCRDASVLTNGWRSFTQAAPVAKTLAPQETLELQIGIDRLQVAGVAGTRYGALLSVRDVTPAGSGFRAVVPLEVASDGGASAAGAWPSGMWLMTAELDRVTHVSVNGQGALAPAGGTMKVRLPMQVDGDRTMTLRQRFYCGESTNGMRRVSTPFLPVDQPAIPAHGGSVFGEQAGFSFTVAENSRVNPLRHALHPQHDGMRADFETPAPSGSDFGNYVSKVKPELFAVTNTVKVVWDATDATAWSPDETLSGTLEWRLDGVRHEGPVVASGKFSMKRISKGEMK